MNPRRHRYMYATTLPFIDFTPPSYCTVEEDGAPNGGGGGGGAPNGGANGDGGTPVPVAAPQPDWQQFIGGLDTLNAQLGGKLDNLVATVQQATAPVETPAAPVDYDSMNNAELSAHIVGSVTRAVESMLTERLAPLTQTIQAVQTDVGTRDVRAQIDTLKATHKDFNDWLPEMRALATEQPSLSVNRLYVLVRAENPAKAGELDKRYAPPAPPPRLPFGGFTPGSSGKPGAPAVLDAATAGREAYREVSERHPGVLAALNEL